jgi:hypothetical protein
LKITQINFAQALNWVIIKYLEMPRLGCALQK